MRLLGVALEQSILATGGLLILIAGTAAIGGPLVLLTGHGMAAGWLATTLEGVAAATGIMTAAILMRAIGSARLAHGRRLAATEQARLQMEQLFRMTEMLDSATTRLDACHVVAAAATRLWPRLHGELYAANLAAEGAEETLIEQLNLATAWGTEAARPPAACPPAACLDPSGCWALKRQKPHRNERGPGALRCAHAGPSNEAADRASLELPLIGQGEIFGVLVLAAAAGTPAADELQAAEPLALLLAEAATRALTSIALREKLKNDAVRDGLTGLYNRRFLEELQERLSLSAERRKAPLSAIMIDIDHFKRINDEHGHSTGDAVLRAVAQAAVAALRRTDLICRYGGEELMVLLPDCPLGHATERAELLRTRIAELTEAGLSVTASFGVASIPETSSRSADLFAAADAALYAAKQAGRNRVVAAPVRPAAATISLAEARGA